MDDDFIDEAARWHAAQASDAMDWDGFTVWLEASPRNREAFDRVALLDDAIGQQREAIAERLPPREVSRPRHWIGIGAGGAVAAALALVIGLPMMRSTDLAPLSYRTAAGETRSVTLPDGARIVLASASSLTVSGAERDRLALRGSAFFDVPHRPDRTLSIAAGDFAIRDIGTRFAIVADGSRVRVEVAEGAVSVASAHLAAPIELRAGKRFSGDSALGSVRLATVAAGDVGSWRSGQLRYSGVPLALVADDLARYTGQVVTVDEAARNSEFTGVLTIGDGSKLVGTVAGIMGLQVRAAAGGQRLAVRSGT
jgi:transmembrane sensor